MRACDHRCMEIEFKFQIPPGQLAGVAQALQADDCQRTPLQARYFDTADGALAAQGVVLRLRKEGPRWVQTVKALGDGPVARLEHNVDLGPAGKAVPGADPARHAGTPAGSQLARALDGRAVPLVEVYGTDIQRTARVVQQGASRIELALDQGHVTAPAVDGGPLRMAAVCELELELVDGDVADLTALAAQWAQAHGLWFSTVSKAERGLRLAHGQSTRPAVKARPPLLGTRGKFPGGPALQRAVLRACLDQILPNASEIAAGSDDAEHIHQLRVGLRRLRTALRELAPLGPGFDEAWQAPLRATFSALGAQRDRQLLASTLLPRIQAAGGPSFVLPPDEAGPPAAGDAVRGSAFQAVLVALIGLASAPDGQGASPKQTRERLARRLHKLHASTVREGRRFDELASSAQHSVRKRLKRLRYLAEFVGAAFDAEQAARYRRALEPAQDALGDYLDEQVGWQACQALAQQVPQAWFAVGWLQARQPQGARASRKALKALQRAPVFWKK